MTGAATEDPSRTGAILNDSALVCINDCVSAVEKADIVMVGDCIPAVVISVVDDLVSASDAEMVGDCIPAGLIGSIVTADDLASVADVVMVAECIPVVVIVTLRG